MTKEQSLTQVEAPSTKAIVRATLIALAIALIILFTAVLPAEYGIDPLRTGALLGLTGISEATDNGTGGRATPAQSGIYTVQPKTTAVRLEVE